MTPKEKAKELCEHYSKLVFYSTNSFDKKLVPEIRTFVKQCALIAVNEIINIDVLIDEDTWVSKTSYLEFWKQVKKEIESYENSKKKKI